MVATKREIMLNLPTQHKLGVLQWLIVQQPVQFCPLCRGVAVFVLHGDAVDGNGGAIDCAGVEDALDVTMAQRAELDYLIYNDPLGYADLILNGDPEGYLKIVGGSHGSED